MTLSTFLKLEIKNFLSGKAVIVAGLFFLLAGVYAIHQGKSVVDKQCAIIAEIPQFQAEHAAKQIELNKDDLGNLLYYLQHSTVHEPSSWAAFSIGQRDVNPYNIKVKMLTLEGQIYDSEISNPMNLLYGNFDPAFVIVFLLPLLIVAFCHNLISAEQENGIWNLLRSQPISVAKILYWRLLIRFVVVLFGDKTSLVINAITRSGLNQLKPTGSFFQTVGRFRTIQDEANFAIGNSKVGNFTAFNFERSNRFLDAPKFVSLHNRGTSGSVFNHFDYSPSTKDVFHLNLFYARNNFQTANTYEQQALGQDQRQKVETINIAPGYVHVFNASTVLTINPYYRNDQVNYYPSANPFSDQTTTISQSRRLANAGVKADVSYVKGINNIKAGVQFHLTRAILKRRITRI